MTYTFEGKVVGHRVNRQFSMNEKNWKEIPTNPVSQIEMVMTPNAEWPTCTTFEVDGAIPLGTLAKMTLEIG